jgi:hypothetical protein
MTILKNCEINFLKAHPTKLPKPYKAGEESKWSVMLKTTDKATRDYWKGLSLKVNAVVPDEGDPYFTTNIYKNCTKKDGTPAAPVDVEDGDGNPIDPMRISNGSIANVRIFQWENGAGKISTQLQALQIVTWIVREASERESFERAETKVITPTPEGDSKSETEVPY